MSILKVAQYYPQTDSHTGHSSRMCWSSTTAMAIKYLRPEALLGSNADDDYLRLLLKLGGDTIYPWAHIRTCREYGVKATYTQAADIDDFKRAIDAGKPCGLGWLHHGPVSRPRGGGHWTLVFGYTSTHLINHDPYGEADMVNGGYVAIGRGGKGVRYTWRNFNRRWQPEGPGHGYLMTYERA